MTNEQKQVRDWMVAFGQETPDKPVIPSFEVRKLRAKLILEEALETIYALGVHVKVHHPSQPTVIWFCAPNDGNVIEFERGAEPNLKEILDGCEDLKIVTEGTLVACGLLQESENTLQFCEHCHKGEDPAFNEVMRSNWSKMWTTKEVKEKFNIDKVTFAFEMLIDGYTINNVALKEQDKHNENSKQWLVKDSSGKVIKSPSYSPANLEQFVS